MCRAYIFCLFMNDLSSSEGQWVKVTNCLQGNHIFNMNIALLYIIGFTGN